MRAGLSCADLPSSSTTTRCSRQRQSSLRLLPPTSIGTLVSGAGMFSVRQSSRKACSSSLRTTAPGRCALTAAMRVDRRLRPFALAIAWSSIGRSSTPWNSASLMMRVSRSRPNMSVRSTSVRATVVTGMPCLTVTSSGERRRTRWRRMPLAPSLDRRAVVTWITTPGRGWIPQSTAASTWLRTASGPLASTAASQFPSWVSRGLPTANTPLYLRCRRPFLTRRWTALP